LGSPLLVELQRGWWLIGLVGALVGVLGFQTLPPSRRLVLLEGQQARQASVDLRQDSALAAHVRETQRALDGINRQLSQLIEGQCVKERDRMARIVYGCGGARR
jgi:hypothetical protein